MKDRVSEHIHIDQSFPMAEPRVQMGKHVQGIAKARRHASALDIANTHHIRLEHCNEEQHHGSSEAMLKVR